MSEADPSPPGPELAASASAGRGVRWIRGAEAFEADVVAALTRPVVSGRFWVDLEPAHRWLQARKAEGGAEGLTYTHLFVKAAAMAAMASPDLHRMYGPLRCLDPATADVGVSIAAEGIVAPTVVLPAADRKPVSEIARELREKAAEVRRDHVRTRALADRYLWLLPVPFLRRLLVRLAFASPSVRRRIVGTIQLTNVGLSGGEDTYVPMVGELLLSCGAIEKRVVPDEGDRPVVRRGVVFMLHASHRKLSAVTSRPFVSRFRELLASPEKFASYSTGERGG